MVKKVLVIVLGTALAGGIGIWLPFLSWKDQIREELLGGSVVISTAQGEVEFARLGSGPTLAVLHGTPGGYDQVTNPPDLAPDYVPAGMSLLAISRPGYLRTPLDSGRTPEEQADLLAALLEKSGPSAVTVMGISGGGPAALQFALRHQDKTRALILLSARTKSHPDDSHDDEPSAIDRVRAVIGTDFLIWMLGDRIAASLAGGQEVDASTLSRLKSVVLSTALIDQRLAGRANDNATLADPRLDDWALADISAPTLIVYGNQDSGVSPAESVHAHERIPGSKLVVLEGGHFIGATHAEQVQAEIEAWLTDLDVL